MVLKYRSNLVTRISKLFRKLSIQQESLRERPKKSEVDRLKQIQKAKIY